MGIWKFRFEHSEFENLESEYLEFANSGVVGKSDSKENPKSDLDLDLGFVKSSIGFCSKQKVSKHSCKNKMYELRFIYSGPHTVVKAYDPDSTIQLTTYFLLFNFNFLTFNFSHLTFCTTKQQGKKFHSN